MQLLQPGYRFTRNERWTLSILIGGAVVVLASARVPWLDAHLPVCPIHQLLGIHCPGCGLTRAAQSLVQLELPEALLQNPLIAIVAPFALYRLLAILVGAITGRRLLTGWPGWFVKGYQMAFVGTWMLLAVVRVVSALAPEANPLGLGLP